MDYAKIRVNGVGLPAGLRARLSLGLLGQRKQLEVEKDKQGKPTKVGPPRYETMIFLAFSYFARLLQPLNTSVMPHALWF